MLKNPCLNWQDDNAFNYLPSHRFTQLMEGVEIRAIFHSLLLTEPLLRNSSSKALLLRVKDSLETHLLPLPLQHPYSEPFIFRCTTKNNFNFFAEIGYISPSDEERVKTGTFKALCSCNFLGISLTSDCCRIIVPFMWELNRNDGQDDLLKEFAGQKPLYERGLSQIPALSCIKFLMITPFRNGMMARPLTGYMKETASANQSTSLSTTTSPSNISSSTTSSINSQNFDPAASPSEINDSKMIASISQITSDTPTDSDETEVTSTEHQPSSSSSSSSISSSSKQPCSSDRNLFLTQTLSHMRTHVTSSPSSSLLDVGHRGSGANARHDLSVRRPVVKENTLLSFLFAHNVAHIDWVETDAQLSADGVVVLSHDFMATLSSKLDVPVCRLTSKQFTGLREVWTRGKEERRGGRAERKIEEELERKMGEKKEGSGDEKIGMRNEENLQSDSKTGKNERYFERKGAKGFGMIGRVERETYEERARSDVNVRTRAMLKEEEKEEREDREENEDASESDDGDDDDNETSEKTDIETANAENLEIKSIKANEKQIEKQSVESKSSHRLSKLHKSHSWTSLLYSSQSHHDCTCSTKQKPFSLATTLNNHSTAPESTTLNTKQSPVNCHSVILISPPPSSKTPPPFAQTEAGAADTFVLPTAPANFFEGISLTKVSAKPHHNSDEQHKEEDKEKEKEKYKKEGEKGTETMNDTSHSPHQPSSSALPFLSPSQPIRFSHWEVLVEDDPTTLASFLRFTPPSLGLFLEVKYAQDEFQESQHMKLKSRNEVVDAILDTIADCCCCDCCFGSQNETFEGSASPKKCCCHCKPSATSQSSSCLPYDRSYPASASASAGSTPNCLCSRLSRIVFTAFDPDIVTMLLVKQQWFGVFMNCVHFSTPDIQSHCNFHPFDPRAMVPNETVRFVRNEGGSGICCLVDSLLEHPRIAANARRNGLAVMSFGERNVRKPVRVYEREQLGVSGIICDNAQILVREEKESERSKEGDK
eukprot:MONOS_12142.1-p1 / transcript=MONOS_12142.1 / gene=MONOS_12142 / organism=Monocercomonoides_exilis_PA203 / gene_product=unspecified product / transcript_product=unspecified product / location=Mono_scaffold00651:32470-35454(-) / protein_length=994 / sequence_SO=supercontig / SO=protein_coding / is_pseudo=false